MGQGQTHTNHMSFKDSKTSQALCSGSVLLLTRLPAIYMYKYKWYTIIHAHSDALQSLSCGHSGCLLSDFTFTHLALSLT